VLDLHQGRVRLRYIHRHLVHQITESPTDSAKSTPQNIYMIYKGLIRIKLRRRK
jgi:hypothetical protein